MLAISRMKFREAHQKSGSGSGSGKGSEKGDKHD
jgi:ribosomal protein L19E